MKDRSFKGWSIILAVLLVAVLAIAPARLALADTGGVQGHAFNVTFTKWITAFPNMAGVGGGAIGPATFAGEIVSLEVVGSAEYVHAIYHLKGSKHSFTADLYVTQDDLAGTGFMTGRVTNGWLKGASVTGEYKLLAECNMDTPGNSMGTLCFQGVLNLRRAP